MSYKLESAPTTISPQKILWYRSTWFAATILGLCNLCAPGIWGSLASLGAGGQASPYVVNTANALTFCLMIVTAFLTPVMVRFWGVKWTLAFGAAGYAPYAAGLYSKSVHNVDWVMLLGAAICGISAGAFWAIEAAIALSYPEPENVGRFLGWWLSFRVGGGIIGGAINLGLNANRSEAGSVSTKVYIIFIVIQCIGPFIAFLLPSPNKVQRKDGLQVKLFVDTKVIPEIKATARLFFTKKFLLLVPLISQAVFPESFNGNFLALTYSVRARSLGSFLSAVVAIIAGNLLGQILDRKTISLKTKARAAFGVAVGLQGCWWVWSTILQSTYHRGGGAVYDWSTPGFGKGFALYIFLVAGFQLNYMYLYFVVGTLVTAPADIVRIAGLLRATESAAQALAYGLTAIRSLSLVSLSAINFGLWAVAIFPAWLVIKDIGVEGGYWGRAEKEVKEREELLRGESVRTSDSKAPSEKGSDELVSPVVLNSA